jgi:hypothetical protein
MGAGFDDELGDEFEDEDFDAPLTPAQTRLKEQNERQREAFERGKGRRQDYLDMDARIQRIANKQSEKMFYNILGFTAIGAGYYQYGWVGGVAASILFFAFAWRIERSERDNPSFGLGEIDDLAEDTVTHERIVELAGQGVEWLKLRGQWVEADVIFDAPFWELVNKRVRTYRWMTYKARHAENQQARIKSLPVRHAMLISLKRTRLGVDLPAWAEIRSDEAKSRR